MSQLRSTQQMRAAWGPPCDAPNMVPMTFTPGVHIRVNRRSVEAWRALARVFLRHSYHVRPGDTGAYNCRAITGGTSPSLHSYGIALDINWDTNPYRLDRLVTDLPRALTDDVKRVVTFAGVRAIRWGGDFNDDPDRPDGNYDAMHFEVNCTPAELANGIPCEAGVDDRPATWPTLVKHDRGPAVVRLQRELGMLLRLRDGVYGDRTWALVAAYQRSRGLVADGVVGPATWTAFFTAMPPLPAGAPKPDKSGTRE